MNKKTIELTPREYISWFVKKNKINGHEISYVKLSSGREVHFDNMTDEDANLIASQFMLMMMPSQGQS